MSGQKNLLGPAVGPARPVFPAGCSKVLIFLVAVPRGHGSFRAHFPLYQVRRSEKLPEADAGRDSKDCDQRAWVKEEGGRLASSTDTAGPTRGVRVERRLSPYLAFRRLEHQPRATGAAPLKTSLLILWCALNHGPCSA
jgi:hypothetical protein